MYNTENVGVVSRDWKKAIERGLRLADDANSAESARYSKETKELQVVLRNGVKISIPSRLIQRLATADEDKAAIIIIESDGHGLHWPELDFDLYVPSLVIGVYPLPRSTPIICFALVGGESGLLH